MPESELQMAERHVAEGERHVVEQEELVSRLELDGLPTSDAQELLSTFHATLAVHREHLSRLQDEQGFA